MIYEKCKGCPWVSVAEIELDVSKASTSIRPSDKNSGEYYSLVAELGNEVVESHKITSGAKNVSKCKDCLYK